MTRRIKLVPAEAHIVHDGSGVPLRQDLVVGDYAVFWCHPQHVDSSPQFSYLPTKGYQLYIRGLRAGEGYLSIYLA